MWALGALLYQLVTGVSLVHGDRNDAASSAGALGEVAGWSEGTKAQRLGVVGHRYARHLLSLLLARAPEERPSALAVLQHPFLTGAAVPRLPGEDYSHDVFLSYRVASDLGTVSALYHRLRALGLAVWWDKRALSLGDNWRSAFCLGLARSKVFVPLVSHAALQEWPRLDPATAKCDNLLLEHRLALELQALKLLGKDAIGPVLLGRCTGSATGSGEEGLPEAFESFFEAAAVPPLPEAQVRSVGH